MFYSTYGLLREIQSIVYIELLPSIYKKVLCIFTRLLVVVFYSELMDICVPFKIWLSGMLLALNVISKTVYCYLMHCSCVLKISYRALKYQ